MARKPSGNPNGRPLTEINKKTFEELCGIWCTQAEIAAILDINVDTLHAWCLRTYGEGFSETYAKFSSGGKASLRRTQLRLSESSPALAIWLGKVYLGQKEEKDEIDTQALQALANMMSLLQKNRDSSEKEKSNPAENDS